MRESAGQVPLAASPAPHSGTLDSTPSMPGGWRTDSRDRKFWRSSRVTVTVNGENAPACGSWVPAAKPRLNGVGGQAPPAPSLSTVKAEAGVAAGWPEYGVRALVVVAGPHASGVASVAPGPPANVNVKCSKGTCGVSLNVAVRRPVCGSGCTEPTSRIVRPKPWASRNRRYGSSGSGLPRYTDPASAAGSTGPSMLTPPVTPAPGHAIGSRLPFANCASVHASRPFAAAGLIVIPSGSVTAASLTCAVASVAASELCGTWRSTAALVGSSACV